MNTQDKGFVISDDIYHDDIRTHPAHFNAMRHKPTYPPTYIDANIAQLKSFPHKWKSYVDAENVSNLGKPHLAKRCLFYDVSSGEQIHLSSLDSLTYRYMLPEIKFPDEDFVTKTIGPRRRVYDKRNQLDQVSPGDKPYKAVEYSPQFFDRVNRNWRSEKNRTTRGEQLDQLTIEELGKLLGLTTGQSAGLFKPKHDLNYEADEKWERNYEINNIKSLDEWKPAPKLEAPFKVLDHPDKNFKYRPKVTK